MQAYQQLKGVLQQRLDSQYMTTCKQQKKPKSKICKVFLNLPRFCNVYKTTRKTEISSLFKQTDIRIMRHCVQVKPKDNHVSRNKVFHLTTIMSNSEILDHTIYKVGRTLNKRSKSHRMFSINYKTAQHSQTVEHCDEIERNHHTTVQKPQANHHLCQKEPRIGSNINHKMRSLRWSFPNHRNFK